MLTAATLAAAAALEEDKPQLFLSAADTLPAMAVRNTGLLTGACQRAVFICQLKDLRQLLVKKNLGAA